MSGKDKQVEKPIKNNEKPNVEDEEQFGLIDGRLAICSLAVGIAGVALGYDFYHPFPESKTCLIICVISYFILMGVLTLYTQYREKGIFAVAIDKS
uniref:Signal peptidase complex subunit 2 n=1 Tax=Megaselia scalaris TaxID=36166 RepID=T1GK79_MEGSC